MISILILKSDQFLYFYKKPAKVMVPNQNLHQIGDMDKYYNDLKSKYDQKHNERLPKFREEGKKDGEMNLPNLNDETPSNVESTIKAEYQGEIAELFKDGKPALDGPHAQYQEVKENIDFIKLNVDEYKARKKKLAREKFDAEIQYLNEHRSNELEKTEDERNKILSKWHTAQDEYKEVTTEVGRDRPIIHIKPAWLVWGLLILLGICEIPLNYTVFANFYLPNIETFILAGLLVIAVPILSHFSGIFLKQSGETKAYIFYFIIVFLVMVALSIAVGMLRTDYINTVIGASSTSNQSVNTVTFILLSLLLYIVGIIISYFHHDKSQLLAISYKDFQKAKVHYEESILPWNEMIVNVNAEFSKNKKELENGLQKRYEEIENKLPEKEHELMQIASLYDKILNTFIALERIVYENYNKCIGEYRTENHRHRNNHQRPISWTEPKDKDFIFYFEGMPELDPN
ncbi:MAG: hypothetical protein P9M03_11505 [Candidatus Theseobacter exili]|nr:hypothetical protein [Candidatus Theseobacter exili]